MIQMRVNRKVKLEIFYQRPASCYMSNVCLNMLNEEYERGNNGAETLIFSCAKQLLSHLHRVL